MGLDERSARHDLYEAQIELSSPVCRQRRRGGRVAERAASSRCARPAELRSAPASIPRAGSATSGSSTPSATCARARDCADWSSGRPTAPFTCTSACPTRRRRSASATACASTSRCWRRSPANSPFWHGRRFRASRAHAASLRRGFPRVDIPPAFSDFADYAGSRAGSAGGSRARRLHVRVVGGPAPPAIRHGRGARDGQPVLAGERRGARSARSGARKAFRREPRRHVAQREVIAEASFRAGRDGIAATPATTAARSGRCARSRRMCSRSSRPHARELGSEAPLEEVERILRDGNGADRQRAAHDSGGMPAVLRVARRPRPPTVRVGLAAGGYLAVTGCSLSDEDRVTRPRRALGLRPRPARGLPDRACRDARDRADGHVHDRRRGRAARQADAVRGRRTARARRRSRASFLRVRDLDARARRACRGGRSRVRTPEARRCSRRPSGCRSAWSRRRGSTTTSITSS